MQLGIVERESKSLQKHHLFPVPVSVVVYASLSSNLLPVKISSHVHSWYDRFGGSIYSFTLSFAIIAGHRASYSWPRDATRQFPRDPDQRSNLRLYEWSMVFCSDLQPTGIMYILYRPQCSQLRLLYQWCGLRLHVDVSGLWSKRKYRYWWFDLRREHEGYVVSLISNTSTWVYGV
jgi:hypothetical protein